MHGWSSVVRRALVDDVEAHCCGYTDGMGRAFNDSDFFLL